MHILYFHQHFSTPAGSAGTRSYEMARAAVRAGHQVTMVCGSFGQGSTDITGDFIGGQRRGLVDGIDVIEIAVNYNNHLGFMARTLVFLRYAMASIGIALRTDYDLVFATTTPLTAGIPGICARWIRKKPFIFEVRDLWPELPRAMGVIRNPVILWLMGVLEWASYRSAHRCIGLSPGIVAGIERRGVAPDRIAMVPNGCDLALFAADAPPWRPESIPADTFLAVFTGTHGKANGLETAIDAAIELKRRGRSDVMLLLVGDGGEKPRLMEQAASMDLPNLLFHSPVPKKQLAGLMHSADLGLQILQNVEAFYYGTSPNKFFDYLAAGLPVLNNYPGWVADLVTEHGCGFAVPPDNPTAFADALVKAADDRAAARAMGNRARELAEQQFDRVVLGEKWVEWVTGSGPLDGQELC